MPYLLKVHLSLLVNVEYICKSYDHSYFSLHVACRLPKATAENHSRKSWRHSSVEKIASKVHCELLHVFFIRGP